METRFAWVDLDGYFMFEYLIGQIQEKTPTYVVLEVNGIAFKLFVPLSTYEKLPDQGEVKIYVSLYLQNALQGVNVRLYGFASTLERKFFQLLSTVNRVGPNTALKILSGISLAEFRQAVLSEDIGLIGRVKGVGQKTAQRMIVELKETFRTWVVPAGSGPPDGEAGRSGGADFTTDAVLALVSLGYSRLAAEKAVKNAWQKVPPNSQLADLIKMSLRQA